MHQDTTGRRRRRKHSPAYKAELVQLCLSSGASPQTDDVDTVSEKICA